MASKWNIYDSQIKDLLHQNSEQGFTNIAKSVLPPDPTPLDIKLIETYIRRNKSRLLDLNEGIYDACAEINVDFTSAKHLWIKTKDKSGGGVSGFIKNPNYVPTEITEISTLKEDLIKDLQQYAPKFPKLERIENTDSYLLVLDPADLHLGKLALAYETGEDYNNQIAVKRALDGVRGILQKVSSFHIDKILFIGGNDILHIDNPFRTTTAGTKQDTDGMWHTNFLIAKQLYVDILEILIGVADVHFVFCPSNHDYTNGFFLAQVVETYFKNCENITFDSSITHRKGFKYFNNLIGTTHGDGAKQQDLPLLMAQEFSREWADTKHRYVYTHHVHHKTSKDYIGITVESLRSPSGADSWHSRNGFIHAPKAVEGFLHCKQNGQIARITHIFSLLLVLSLFI